MACLSCNKVSKTVKGVAEGTKNIIIRNPEIESKASERLNVCFMCIHYREKLKVNGEVKASQCEVCKCVLELKTRVVTETCPINKW